MSDELQQVARRVIDVLRATALDLDHEPAPDQGAAELHDYERRIAERLRVLAAELERAAGR